ncbi:MAG: hypothetical protein ACTTH8_02530 [Treponema sp.]
MKKIILAAVLYGIISSVLYAEKEHDRIEYTTKITTALAFPLETVTSITEHIKIPVLHFDTPLTKDNNITLKPGIDISPVSIEGKFEAAWTPVAFFEFYTGGSIGSGWNIPGLGIRGLALNTEYKMYTQYVPIDFQRMVYSFYCGGALQFDLAAFVPGEWSHLVCRIDQYGIYKGLHKTDNLTSWVWKHDSGTNRNGWRYNASYILGYQTPLPLNMIALRVETEKTFFAVPANKDKRLWGEDRFKVTFGPLFNFEITNWFSILLLAQFETLHTSHISEDVFYQNRFIHTSKQDTVHFKRVGAVFDITLKHN